MMNMNATNGVAKIYAMLANTLILSELFTFLQINNVNIDAIHETFLTNKSMPLKSPGWASVRLDHHKNKGGGLLMLVKNTIPFVDNKAALPTVSRSSSGAIRF